MIDRRTFLAGIAGGLLPAPLCAEAQQEAKIARIGYLALNLAAGDPRGREAFLQAFA
jgi:hypothetical protein